MANEIANIEFSGVVVFDGAKGAVHQLTVEAALVKGGKALAEVRESAIVVAIAKAMNGKYRSAAEIMGLAFPKVEKAYAALFGGQLPWANKVAFMAFLDGVENAKPGKSGDWTAKQLVAREVLHALRRSPSFRKAPADVALCLEMETTAPSAKSATPTAAAV